MKYCADTGDKIWYTTVTLADLRKLQRTGGDTCTSTTSQPKKQLVRIPSPHERQLRYELAAEAIASREAQLLPTFGGRPWKISVKVSEPHNTQQRPPLFRWFRGQLELAVLPHLLQKIPEIGMASKGKAKQEEVGTEVMALSTALSERTVSQLSLVAWSDTEYMTPTVTIKWLSPNHKTFTSRKSAEEEATRLQADQLLLDKLLFGIGARGQRLRPTKPTKADALKAGKLRFLRDGLWVIGQENSWQADRADLVEKEEQTRAEQTAIKAEEQSKMDTEEVAKPKLEPKKRQFSALTYFVSTKRDAYRDQRQAELDLKHPNETNKFTLKDADTELKETFKLFKLRQRMQWKEMANEANAANRHICLSGIDYFILMGRDDMERRLHDAFISIHGRGIINRKKKATFIADEEEEKKEDATAIGTGSDRDSEYGVVKDTISQSVFNPCTVLTKLREQWTLLSEKCQTEWIRKAKEYSETETERRRRESKFLYLHKRASEALVVELRIVVESTMTSGASPKHQGDDDVFSRVEEEVVISFENPLKTIATALFPPSHVNASQGNQPDMFESKNKAERVPSHALVVGEVNTQRKRRRPLSNCPPRRFGVSDHWRMSNQHVNLCYDAAMDHYDKVMYTVKARALFAELADGFDVLRERGRGRYDMELPAFESPVFSFLTCLENAAWMPVVWQILGDDVTLIHKGVFLSMPGAEHQNYHQDGPHLNSKIQLPCHAVNVFIPLVDLTARNGPTEFSLGSHILGFEGYDKANVYLPQVQAGTPIIFDYRLGHRGLANSGTHCRPILYCTYAASKDGKEFRDSVNFSARRYHKIGTLVEKPISREERAKKRKVQLEEQKCLEMIRHAKCSNEFKQKPVTSTETIVEGVTDPLPQPTATPPSVFIDSTQLSPGR